MIVFVARLTIVHYLHLTSSLALLGLCFSRYKLRFFTELPVLVPELLCSLLEYKNEKAYFLEMVS